MPPDEVRVPAPSEEDRPAENQIATKQLDGIIVRPAADIRRELSAVSGLHGAFERPTPVKAALQKVLGLPDLRERFALCLLNVYGDEKNPEYWRARARDFEWAAPKRGDFHGDASREQLLDRWQRCQQLAELCRFHADLLEGLGNE